MPKAKNRRQVLLSMDKNGNDSFRQHMSGEFLSMCQITCHCLAYQSLLKKFMFVSVYSVNVIAAMVLSCVGSYQWKSHAVPEIYLHALKCVSLLLLGGICSGFR